MPKDCSQWKAPEVPDAVIIDTPDIKPPGIMRLIRKAPMVPPAPQTGVAGGVQSSINIASLMTAFKTAAITAAIPAAVSAAVNAATLIAAPISRYISNGEGEDKAKRHPFQIYDVTESGCKMWTGTILWGSANSQNPNGSPPVDGGQRFPFNVNENFWSFSGEFFKKDYAVYLIQRAWDTVGDPNNCSLFCNPITSNLNATFWQGFPGPQAIDGYGVYTSSTGSDVQGYAATKVIALIKGGSLAKSPQGKPIVEQNVHTHLNLACTLHKGLPAFVLLP